MSKLVKNRTALLLTAVLGAPTIIGMSMLLEFTTFGYPANYPRGIIIGWYKDSVVTSGVVEPLWAFFMRESPVRDFLSVSDVTIYNPTGKMPYFKKITGSNLRYVVDWPKFEYTLYIIDDGARSMYKVDSNNYDIGDIGYDFPTKTGDRHLNAYFDSQKNQVLITNESPNVRKEVTIDLVSRKVIDLRLSEIK